MQQRYLSLLATWIIVAIVCAACQPVRATSTVRLDRTASYGPVKLSYPTSLAAQVVAEEVKGVTEEQAGGMSYAVMPDHIRLTFQESYAECQPLYRQSINMDTVPQVLVFDTQAFEVMSPLAKEHIAALRTLLRERPSMVAEEIFILPMANAAQMFHAQLDYLEFSEGAGIRFVTQYAQETRHVNNQEIFYTFQGLTADERYYVAAFFPVNSAVLPAGNCAKPDCSDAPQRPDETDVDGASLALDTLAPADFAPNLSILDAVIGSLTVEASPQGAR